jgi:hypothetical protein
MQVAEKFCLHRKVVVAGKDYRLKALLYQYPFNVYVSYTAVKDRFLQVLLDEVTVSYLMNPFNGLLFCIKEIRRVSKKAQKCSG